MNESLVHIATFPSEPQAEQARIALQRAGIAASLGGGAAATVLSSVGAAVGGVRLYTLSKDAPKALSLLQTPAMESSEVDQGWYCGACHEEVDPGFDVCWSCGRNRDKAAVTRPIATQDNYQVDDSSRQNTPSDSSIAALVEHSNPYAAPRESENLQRQEKIVAVVEDEELPELPGEAMVLRAWRAAVLGLVFLPVILHCYSMILLLRAATISDDFSPRANLRFYQTWGLNVLGIAAYSAILFFVF